MRNAFRKIMTLAAMALLLATAALAQGPGGPPPGDFRDEHKYTFQLMHLARQIGEIDKNSKYALSPAQAKKVFAVLKPLRSKPQLTQAQAKVAVQKLQKVFTAAQLKAIAQAKPHFGHRMAGGPPGGPGPQAGPREHPHMRMDPGAMKNFNPFYAKDNNPMSKHWDGFFNGLEKKAKSAKK